METGDTLALSLANTNNANANNNENPENTTNNDAPVEGTPLTFESMTEATKIKALEEPPKVISPADELKVMVRREVTEGISRVKPGTPASSEPEAGSKTVELVSEALPASATKVSPSDTPEKTTNASTKDQTDQTDSIPLGGATDSSSTSVSSPPSTEIVRTLFVSGLPMDATPRELYLLFRPYKGFLESKLNTARNKYGKVLSPIGFVTFDTREDAETALDELQDALFDPYLPNTTLRLEFAKSNSKIPSTNLLSSTTTTTTTPTTTSTAVNKESAAGEKGGEKEKEKAGSKQQNSPSPSFLRNGSSSGLTGTGSGTGTTGTGTSSPYYHPHHPLQQQQQQQQQQSQQQLLWPHGTAAGLAAGNGTGSGLGLNSTTNSHLDFPSYPSYYGSGSADLMAHHQGLPYGASSSSILSVPSSTTTSAANPGNPTPLTKGGQGQTQGQGQGQGHAVSASSTQPCSTLFIGNLGTFVSEHELSSLFASCPGYVHSRLYTKGMSPVAFVRFVDVRCASQAMAALQGSYLRYSDRGGIRIEYAKSKMNDRDVGLTGGLGLGGYGNGSPFHHHLDAFTHGDNNGWTPYPLIPLDSWIDQRSDFKKKEQQQRQRDWSLFPGLDRF